MSDNNYNTNDKRKYNTLLLENPELAELIIDLVALGQKWNAPKVAEMLDTSRQTLQARVNKRKKEGIK
jgi:hypothetical protein